jgi:FemAB-related protein (PEP-CTERM system-associated)
MVIQVSTKIDQSKWDSFICQSPLGNPMQLSGWMHVFEQVFGFETYYFSASEEDEIIGALPLLQVKTALGRNYLTSMPGGILSADKKTARALLDQARDLTSELNAQYLVLRDSFQRINGSDLITDGNHYTMQVDLQPGFNQILKNVKKTTRLRAEKGKRAELNTLVGNDNLADFYPVYQRAMREKGTPTYGFSFFHHALRQFPDQLQLMVILKDDQILGGGFVFDFKDCLFCTWAGLLQKYYPFNTSYALYLDTIKYALRIDKAFLDFGRSYIDSGTYQYKKYWGAKPRQLYQQFYLNKARTPPSVGGNRAGNIFYEVFVKMWGFVPIPITELVGPFLRRQVPFG